MVTPLGSTWLRVRPDSALLELCFAAWRMLKYVSHAENIRYMMSHLVYIWTCSLAGHFELWMLIAVALAPGGDVDVPPGLVAASWLDLCFDVRR